MKTIFEIVDGWYAAKQRWLDKENGLHGKNGQQYLVIMGRSDLLEMSNEAMAFTDLL